MVNILTPWSKPYLTSRVWVADGAMFVRYNAISKQSIAEIWTSIKDQKDIDENVDWLYQARSIDRNIYSGAGRVINNWKDPSVSKNEAFRIVDEWLLKQGWKFLEPGDKLLTLM